MISQLHDAIADAGYDPVPLFDDLDPAFLGIGTRAGGLCCAIYSYQKAVQCFVAAGATEEEAEEWMSHNVTCAWIGPHTPIFVDELGDI